MKIKIELKPNEAREIVYGDSPDFDVIEDKIINHTRWSVIHGVIVKRKNDNKFFKTSYSVGATESQDEQAYEFVSKVTFEEVIPTQKTITVYE